MTPDGADGHWVKDESGVWALVAPSLAWIEQAATADTPPEPPDVPFDAARLVAAEEARTAAKEAVLAAGTLTMARIVAADRAGADAFLAALGAA